ncbi:hypothetical protein DFQ26_004629, partial [Actinomortierella ambigua]
MNSTVMAAATVQNNILLVQYSPTGIGVGDLYAILLTDMTKPLPFQIQRQTPRLKALKHHLASMSLTTLQFKTPPPSKSLASSPDGGGPSPVDNAPQLLAQSPIDPNANNSVAVMPAPPFSDLVLAMNRYDIKTDVWYLKAPDRSAPLDSPVSPPPATGGGPGTGAGTGPVTPSTLPAPLWTESGLPPAFFPKSITVSVGGQRAWSSKFASILTIMMDTNGDQFVSRVVCQRPDLGSADSPASSNAQAPPSSPPSTPPSAGDGGNYSNATAVQSPTWSQEGYLKMDWASSPGVGYTYHITPVPATANGGGFSDGFVGNQRAGS